MSDNRLRVCRLDESLCRLCRSMHNSPALMACRTKWRAHASCSSRCKFYTIVYIYSNDQNACSQVEIKEEFVGDGAEVYLGELFFALVADPSFDDVFGEDVAAEQPGVVLFEGVEHFAQ